MRSALEIVEYFKNGMKNPNEIFEIYEELSKLSEDEIEVYRKSGIGDAIAMKYITAVEMKKKGTWDAYLEEWEKNKNKTADEQLQEYMKERGLSFPVDIIKEFKNSNM